MTIPMNEGEVFASILATVVVVCIVALMIFVVGPAYGKAMNDQYYRSVMVDDFGVSPENRIYWSDGRCVVDRDV